MCVRVCQVRQVCHVRFLNVLLIFEWFALYHIPGIIHVGFGFSVEFIVLSFQACVCFLQSFLFCHMYDMYVFRLPGKFIILSFQACVRF